MIGQHIRTIKAIFHRIVVVGKWKGGRWDWAVDALQQEPARLMKMEHFGFNMVRKRITFEEGKSFINILDL